MISPFKKFCCPMCGLELLTVENALKCEKSHSFDLTRDGYCNLLLVQQKGSSDPGDNKEMVQSRKRFLDSGFYLPIAKRVYDLVKSFSAEKNSSLCVVDAGCGDGYYPHQIQQMASAEANPIRIEMAGFDISKHAIQVAAKRSKLIAWIVASNRKPPLRAGSVDLILSLFGFPTWESFKSIQPKGGRVLLVDSGPDHLIELRKIIYAEVNLTGAPPIEEALKIGYELEKEEAIKFAIKLETASQIHDLLSMTPHAYRMDKAGQERLTKVNCMEITVDVVIRVLRLV